MRVHKVLAVLFVLAVVISQHTALALPAIGWERADSASDGFGDAGNTLISSLAVFEGALYAGTWNIDTGTQVWRGDGSTWRRVAEPGFGDPKNVDIHCLVEFDGYLYAGTDNAGTRADGYDYPGEGAELFRTADGEDWERVVGHGLAGAKGPGFGASENIEIHAIVEFQDSLYLATNNFDGCEVWRSGDGTDWEKVVGAGLSWTQAGGFGDASNVDGTSMCEFGDSLYLATWNDETGPQVWRTEDGVEWSQASAGLGGPPNRMALAMAAFDGNLYVGTWSRDVAQIWRTPDGTGWEQMAADALREADADRVQSFFATDDTLFVGVHSSRGMGSILSKYLDGSWGLVYTFNTEVTDQGFGAFALYEEALWVGTDNAEGSQLWRFLWSADEEQPVIEPVGSETPTETTVTQEASIEDEGPSPWLWLLLLVPGTGALALLRLRKSAAA